MPTKKKTKTRKPLSTDVNWELFDKVMRTLPNTDARNIRALYRVLAKLNACTHGQLEKLEARLARQETLRAKWRAKQ